MPRDQQLLDLLTALALAIRELPYGSQERLAIGERMAAVLRHLMDVGTIPRENWNL